MSVQKISKVEIITRSSKLDELVQALNDIGVLGMTVSQVFGDFTAVDHLSSLSLLSAFAASPEKEIINTGLPARR